MSKQNFIVPDKKGRSKFGQQENPDENEAKSNYTILAISFHTLLKKYIHDLLSADEGSLLV